MAQYCSVTNRLQQQHSATRNLTDGNIRLSKDSETPVGTTAHSRSSAAAREQLCRWRHQQSARRCCRHSYFSRHYSTTSNTMSGRWLLLASCLLGTFACIGALPVPEPRVVVVTPSSPSDIVVADQVADDHRNVYHVTTDAPGDSFVGVTGSPPPPPLPPAVVLNDSPAGDDGLASMLSRLSKVCPSMEAEPGCICQDAHQRVYLICKAVEDLNRLNLIVQDSVLPPTEIWLRVSNSNFSILNRRTFGGMRIEGLQINLSNVSEITDTAFVDVQEHLKSLALQDNHLAEIPVPALRRLLGMEMLSLAGNRITAVPPATFVGLPSLYYVSLSQNFIVHLQRGSFEPGTRQLALSNNRLRTLNESVQHLTNLEWLLLTGNQLVSLRGELVNMPSLTHLHAGDNNIRDLGGGALSQAPQLKAINVSFNQLEKVDDTYFAGLMRLERLDMSYNRLVDISQDAFRDLQGLKSLNLANNYLTTIRGRLLPLLRLESLVLANNQLNSFDVELDLPTATATLTCLDLSDNRLTSLQGILFGSGGPIKSETVLAGSEGAAGQHPHPQHHVVHAQQVHSSPGHHLVKLEKLFLSGNQLFSLATNVALIGPGYHLPSLKSLLLDRNRMTELDSRLLPDTPRLRLLNVSGNEVASVSSGAFRSMATLIELDLSGNRIQQLESGLLAPLSRLQMLNVSGNLLERVAVDTLEGLRSLNELDLSGNRLEEVDPSAFKYVPDLQVLDLGGNRLKTVREILRPLHALVELNLGDNEVEVLDGQDVESLKNLQLLNLSTNSLMTIGINSQVSLPKLVSLRVDSNRLAHVTTAFRHLPNLHDVDLRHNRLSRLTVETFARNSKLRSIKIQGNPWMCDRSLIELFLGLEVNSTHVDEKPWCINNVDPMEGMLIN